MNISFLSFLKKILPPAIKRYIYFVYRLLNLKLKNIKVKKELANLSKTEKKPEEKLKIFVWEPGGYPHFLDIFGLIIWALKLRGYPTKLLLCRGSKIACTQRSCLLENRPEKWNKSCTRCSILCSQWAKMLNLEYGFIDDYISEKRLKELFKLSQDVKLEDIYNFCFNGYYIGKNVYSSFKRYLKGRPPLKEQERVFRFYLYAGLVNIEMAENFVNKEKPDRIIMSQGAYTDYGVPIKVFLKNNIPVSIGLYAPWGIITDRVCQSFSFVENPEKVSPQMIQEQTWRERENKPLSEEENRQLDRFFSARYDSKNTDFLKFKNNNPVWVIFTHLIWDASGDVYPMVYKDFNEWIVNTLEEISKIKEINWLIKVHPAELVFQPVRPREDYGVLDIVRDNFDKLPPYIKILGNDVSTSNLELYKSIAGGITAVGTSGLELAVLGKPVLLAGDTHYAKKGFTYDSQSRQQYIDHLRNIWKLKPLSEFQKNKARQYAYLYFIKKQIPFDYFKEDNTDCLDSQKIKNIIPGKDKYLDFVSDCIINKKDFILP